MANRCPNVGIVNSRVLVDVVFTTAFAGLAYVWPEIFGAWFSNYMGEAFVFVSVCSFANAGISQKGMKAVAQGIQDGVVPDTGSMKIRLGRYIGRWSRWKPRYCST